MKNVARHVCNYAEEPPEVTLIDKGKPNPMEGCREAEIHDCSRLQTGEHETVKLQSGTGREPGQTQPRPSFLSEKRNALSNRPSMEKMSYTLQRSLIDGFSVTLKVGVVTAQAVPVG